MAILDGIFRRYRESNRNKAIAQGGQPSLPQRPDSHFGQDALQKNPNLQVFNNAKNNIQEIIDRRSVVSRFEP